MGDKTYIYNEVEVVMTGRQAHRPWTQKSRGRQVKRIDVLVEVQPLDTKEHGDWKRWVKPDELFEVTIVAEWAVPTIPKLTEGVELCDRFLEDAYDNDEGFEFDKS